MKVLSTEENRREKTEPPIVDWLFEITNKTTIINTIIQIQIRGQRETTNLKTTGGTIDKKTNNNPGNQINKSIKLSHWITMITKIPHHMH